MREAGKVQRCHVIPHIGEYSVGFHTFGMLTLLETIHPRPTLALYKAVLHHDLCERHTGDLPGILRIIDPELREKFEQAGDIVNDELGYSKHLKLTDSERMWLSALDKLELWMWCHDQANMSNDHVANVIDHMQMWFESHWDAIPSAAQQFFKKFEWSRTKENLKK
jgi:hypothetical protein